MCNASGDILLAADTTTEVNSVALTQGDALLVEATVACRRKHSERLLDTLDWVLAEAELTLDDINGLAISNGPGSFTGLRIGAATWKGLAFAANKPLVAVPTLDALASAAPLQAGMLFVALDARMGEVFGALYAIDTFPDESNHAGHAPNGDRGIVKVLDDAVAPVADFLQDIDMPLLCMGDGALLYREEILKRVPNAVIAPPWQAVPRAAAIGVYAWRLLREGVQADPAMCNPVYLRKSQAELNREKRLLEK